jgi:hypothetical protein
MFQRIWSFVPIHSHLCHTFPDNSASSLKELAVLGPSLKRFSFDALKRQIAVGIDGVHLFDMPALDADEIPFVKAL